jgi:hypothetical protein
VALFAVFVGENVFLGVFCGFVGFSAGFVGFVRGVFSFVRVPLGTRGLGFLLQSFLARMANKTPFGRACPA